MTHDVFPLTCPIKDKCAGLSLTVERIMTFRLKCCLLYSSHIVAPYSQSFCMSSINGCKKISMSISTCLGPNARVVYKRYFHLWYNHGGILNMHIITSHLLCGFLISQNRFIPSMLSPNLIFLVSLEKSS
jgi:hypothetical protein